MTAEEAAQQARIRETVAAASALVGYLLAGDSLLSPRRAEQSGRIIQMSRIHDKSTANLPLPDESDAGFHRESPRDTPQSTSGEEVESPPPGGGGVPHDPHRRFFQDRAGITDDDFRAAPALLEPEDMRTVSPGRCPMSARPTGDSLLILPSAGDASAEQKFKITKAPNGQAGPLRRPARARFFSHLNGFYNFLKCGKGGTEFKHFRELQITDKHDRHEAHVIWKGLKKLLDTMFHEDQLLNR